MALASDRNKLRRDLVPRMSRRSEQMAYWHIHEQRVLSGSAALQRKPPSHSRHIKRLVISSLAAC